MASVIVVLSGNGAQYHLEGEAFTRNKFKPIYEKHSQNCWTCKGKKEYLQWVYVEERRNHRQELAPCRDCKGTGIREWKRRVGEIPNGTEELHRSLCGSAVLRANRKGKVNNMWKTGAVAIEVEIDGRDWAHYVCPACKSVYRTINGNKEE